MENKEEIIITETEEAVGSVEEGTAVETENSQEVEATEVVEEKKELDYPLSINIKAYGESKMLTLNEDSITVDELTVNKKDILLVNRYVCLRNFKAEPTFTVVYKVDETTVTSYEFVQNIEIIDTDFNDKIAFWLKKEEINFEENDWNYFCPIVNGYLTYKYVDTHKVDNDTREINPVTLGMAIAGLLITTFGGIMLGSGKIPFGATGVALGILAFIVGVAKIFKKK